MIGKCTACGQPCEVCIIDYGIGPYEYWGAPGVDVQLMAVSDCCEAPAVDDTGNQITVQNVKDEEKSFFLGE
jgi:hypothetical protein